MSDDGTVLNVWIRVDADTEVIRSGPRALVDGHKGVHMMTPKSIFASSTN